MAATLALSVTSCRSDSLEPAGPVVPRALETRVVELTEYGPCEELGSPRGDLLPIECGRFLSPAQTRELLLLSEPGREAARAERATAAAAAVALSADRRVLERSIRALELEPGDESPDAARLVALGALRHSLARATGNPALLVDALERTYRALQEEPRSKAALFNRAVIEADLGLCRQARRSWRAYLAEDPGSGWAEEGKARSVVLPCNAEDLEDTQPDREPVDPDDLYERAIETLLPRWLAAVSEDPPAAAGVLVEITESGERLVRNARDPWVSDLARELGSMGTRSNYLAAIGGYIRGREHFRNEAYLEARRLLLDARPVLARNRSVVLPWCDLWLGAIDLYEGRFENARSRLGASARSPVTRSSTRLSGKLLWTLGLVELRSGRLQRAFDLFQQAEATYLQGGFESSVASVRTLKAETLARLGFQGESWGDRVAALRALQAPRPHFTLRNGLLEGATAAGRQDSRLAAMALLDEALDLAAETGDSVSTVEVQLFRGDILLGDEETTEAGRAFRQALKGARRIPHTLVRERFENHGRLGLWESLQAPEDTDLRRLEDTIRFYAEKGPSWRHLQALRVKARAERNEGRLDQARRTLDQALRLVRALQADLRQEEVVLQHWESAQLVFDEAIELALDAGDPVRALALLEGARDLEGATEGPEAYSSCPALERADGSEEGHESIPVTLVFGVVGQRIAWWRLDGERCRSGVLPGATVRRAVERVASGAPMGSVAPEDLETLYSELLTVPLEGLSPLRPLVLVPDRFLLQVPFAMLRNPESGDYLLEERATSFRTALEEAPPGQHRPSSSVPRSGWTAVVVADPSFDRRSLPWLPPLPGSRREARGIATLYSKGTVVLLGDRASLSEVRASLPGRQVLHLATHAVASAGGTHDALVLARHSASAASGLTDSADLLAGGGTALQLVVLSACSTLGTTPSRSGGLLGLARPFLKRGVPAVLGTLWPAEDELLADLMIRLHAGVLGGASASQALRRAQLEILASSPSPPCCDWAAVQLIGELPAAPSSTFH